jgi:hypothetical protein
MVESELFVVLNAEGKHNVQNGLKGVAFLAVLASSSSVWLAKMFVCLQNSRPMQEGKYGVNVVPEAFHEININVWFWNKAIHCWCIAQSRRVIGVSAVWRRYGLWPYWSFESMCSRADLA